MPGPAPLRAGARRRATTGPPPIVIGLSAVIFAADGERALALVAREPAEAPPALPFGPFDPEGHRTFEIALRAFVREQTGFELGYVEQLYTFGDRGREAPLARMPAAAGTDPACPPSRVISVSYLALAPAAQETPLGRWASWYEFFPWEDWRAGPPPVLERVIRPRLHAWADSSGTQGRRAARWARAREAFGFDGAPWDEERVLDRYELLYEAGLAPEAAVDRGEAEGAAEAGLGRRMASDHRRILATAIQRLRGKVKYRPVAFELTPTLFTLSTLQGIVEAILGLRLHKQNFRRGLIKAGLVEGVGAVETATGGRPAELHRFRREAAQSRSEGRQALGVPTPRLKDS